MAFPAPRVSADVKSDTMSEASETGTANSGWTSGWDSREELRDLVTRIGLKDVADLHQDRFRVDRKRLEQMLSGDNEAPLPADVFFEQIMADTDTFISWPSKLKVGAKSKKDPHVRIAGRPEDVRAAKERIMTVLDTRFNRVTMKMDVSYTDHSHIIGKEGLTIKRVMEETRCHVHFPDSNRCNPTEKSNQVSITGNIEGVESARGRVRELIPLVFGFELPVMSQSVDASCPYVAQVQEQYNVQVMFRIRPKLHAVLVQVKGVEWEMERVKQATKALIEFTCENLASQIPVQMTMEISPCYHPLVVGKNHSNLKAIIQMTGCQIMFPDALDPNIPSLKKSNVTISGHIDRVYQARQLLMGSLPILIIFDLPDDDSGNLRTSTDQLMEIQSAFDVTINVRQKAKQNKMICVIKGVERHVMNVYKARNTVLGVEGPTVNAVIPSSYHMPPSLVPVSLEVPRITVNTPTISPLASPLISPTWQYPGPPIGQLPASFMGLVHQPFLYNMQQKSFGSSGYGSSYQSSVGQGSLEQSREGSVYSSISSINTNPSPMESPRNASPNYQRTETLTEGAQTKPKFSSSLMEAATFGGYLGGSERHQEHSYTNAEYEQKRMAASRAMQHRPVGYRVPTNVWSGYGLSHSSPAGMGKDQPKSKKDNDTSPDEMPSTSGIGSFVEHPPTNTANWQDLPSLLASVGLEKYVGRFVTNEIDLTIFPKLTDQNLIDIGVTALGARMKMLLLISEFNRRSSPFSAAPGAERRSSSSLSSTSSPAKENW